MPGQVNNTTILAAENQEIVALNEIRAAIEDGLEITANVDTSGLETAINSLQSGLVSALNSLKATVKALEMNVTQNNYCCGSGCGTSTQQCPPCNDPPSGPGDPPSDHQSDPGGTPAELASRRCKVAMWLINTLLRGIVVWLDDHHIDDWLINPAVVTGTGLLVAVVSGAIASGIALVLGLFITPGPEPTDAVVALVALAIVTTATYLATQGGMVDFSELVSFIDANDEKMICALYNSGNAWTAHSALMAVIDDTSPNLDPGNRNFVSSFFGQNDIFLGLLFYADDRFSLFEYWLTDQPDECPCTDDTAGSGVANCKAANYIFDSFVDSLHGWGTVAAMTWYTTPSFISALSGGLLLTLLGSIYSLVLVGITAWAAFMSTVVSYLGNLFWNGASFFNAFEEIADLFEADKEEVICELFLAQNVDEARAVFADRLTGYLDTVMAANLDWADERGNYENVIMSLLPNTVLNILFEEPIREEVANYDPPDYASCFQCGASAGWVYPIEVTQGGHYFGEPCYDTTFVDISPEGALGYSPNTYGGSSLVIGDNGCTSSFGASFITLDFGQVYNINNLVVDASQDNSNIWLQLGPCSASTNAPVEFSISEDGTSWEQGIWFSPYLNDPVTDDLEDKFVFGLGGVDHPCRYVRMSIAGNPWFANATFQATVRFFGIYIGQ
jgi:hypothetical protein